MHDVSIIVAEQVCPALTACDRFLVMEGGAIVHSSDRSEVDAKNQILLVSLRTLAPMPKNFTIKLQKG